MSQDDQDYRTPKNDPMQLPLSGLEPTSIKRDSFLKQEDECAPLLKKIIEQLININTSLEDICARLSDLDDDGYRRR